MVVAGIELLADLRALDKSDLEIFGFDDDTAAAIWLELEKLPQADGMLSNPNPTP